MPTLAPVGRLGSEDGAEKAVGGAAVETGPDTALLDAVSEVGEFVWADGLDMDWVRCDVVVIDVMEGSALELVVAVVVVVEESSWTVLGVCPGK